jgi:maltooligosyltrehalose synthase
MENIFNPVSTYRVQFHEEFTFRDFRKIISYLTKLGVRTIYASPIFEAVPGSRHGYDGTNPNRINPEIGTMEELLEISSILHENNISWLQDIVPNHLAFHENNEWLMDVLEKGESSKYAHYFDIDWHHPEFDGKLMVPFPGSSLEKILQEKFPEQKHYQLCPWKETDERINYRRFFLVNGLICTNIHLNDVFDDYHQLIRELCAKKVFQGLRVDHIDGLYDPTKYLRDLRRLAGEHCYIIVEKILEPGEQMPGQWPIQGNSGYDFLGVINNLFTDRDAEYDLTAFYFDLTKNGRSVHQQVKEKKSAILNKHMLGELDNLLRLYKNVSERNDINNKELKSSIEEYLVNCPVYRYYDNDYPLMKIDTEENRNKLERFYRRCMQFSGPLMAKGVEDTLMYTYNRFAGHNEVGDSPEFFGYRPERFHEAMEERHRLWPLSMNASSTHDTKRGEDVRARLNALTALHGEWLSLAKQWRQENAGAKHNGMPDDNDEYFIYQAIAGSYPLAEQDLPPYRDRICDYLQKALREAKQHTNWTDPNEEYEKAAIDFAHALIEKNSTFLKSFVPFLSKISDYGMIISFGQLVLKFTCPGIPDVYQGTEMWDLSLVDPDNRRPVDYDLRTRALNQIRPPHTLWETRTNGEIKLALLQQLNIIRNRYNDLLIEGEYVPVQIEGKYAQHAIAFVRRSRSGSLLVAVPLHFAKVDSYGAHAEIPVADWEDTALILPEESASRWEDLINGGEITCADRLSLNEAFQKFPAMILKS